MARFSDVFAPKSQTIVGTLTAGDLILDDGGSLKEAGGTAAITIDASGHVTKVGQDSPSSGEFLKWDGSKAVWDSASGEVAGSVAADNISAGDAAINLTTTSGNITIDAQGNDTDIILKGTDGTSDTTFLTIDGSEAGKATFNDQVVIGDGKLVLNSTAVDATAAEINAVADASGRTAAAIAVADDHFLFFDGAADGDAKVESIADLVSGIAGTGLSASSGQLTVDSITSVGAVNSGSITSGFGSINSGSSTITTTGNISGGDITASGGDIALGNGQNGTVSVEATAHDTAGKNLTITAGPTTAGTTNNIAGGSLTLQAGQGKGSGAGGDIVFQTANAGGSGSSLNSLATALTISDDKSATFTGHVVFAESTSVKCGSNAILSDSSGTMTLSNIDALDATTEATIESAIDTLSNLTSVGTISTGTWQGTAIAQAYIANDAINGDKIADDAINSEHYTDGSIDTAHIADDQVTLAKMAGLARGKIIYGDASGNPAALAVGNADQVLTTDGTDIAWADASGGSTNLNGLSAAAVDVAADSIGFVDANDSNNSKKESIADLATAMAGTGITATNGVFSVTTGSSGPTPAASSAENIIAFQVFT